MWASRLRLPGLAALLLGGVLAGTLLQPAANVDDRPITERARASAATPVDLGGARRADGTRDVVVGFQVGDARTFDGHLDVQLFMVTWGTRPTLEHASLRNTRSGCEYRTEPGAVLQNNAYLRFVRVPGCTPTPTRAAARITLALTFRGQGRVGLLAEQLPRKAATPGWLRFSAEDPETPLVPVVRGRYVDERPRPAWRRVELLAYLWGWPGAMTWIWVCVGVGVALVGLGAGLAQREADYDEAPAGTTVRVGVAAGALAAGVALLYVMVVPPLQAPDEPDHVLSFARAVGDAALEPGVETLARVGHFDRIRFDGAERFLPSHIGRPLSSSWDDTSVFALDVSARSVTTAWWWALLGHVAPRGEAGQTILAIRMANALLFGLAAGVGAALLQMAARRVSGRPVAVFGLLLVPALPFFAMHVSEFSVLISAYVLAAAVVAGLFLDGPSARWLGLPLGMVTAVIVLSGRSGLPFVFVLAAAGFARAAFGTRSESGERERVQDGLVFWGGLAAGLLLVPALSTPAFRDGLWPGDAGDRIPAWFRQVAEAGRRHSSLIAAGAVLGFLGDRLLALVRTRVAVPRWTLLDRATRVVIYGAVAAVVVSLLGSLVTPFPQLVDLDRATPGARAYLLDVFRSMITSPRLWDHDFLLATSFWAGFGWVDTIPPEWYITAVVVLHTCAALMLLLHLARDERWRRLAWLVVLGLGWTAALGAYAASSYYLHRNVHGRYLVGFYVSLLAVIWCAPSLPAFRERLRRALGRMPLHLEQALVLTLAGLHAYALRVILMRYF